MHENECYVKAFMHVGPRRDAALKHTSDHLGAEAILSKREAPLIYFPLIMLMLAADSEPSLYVKIKKNGGYLFRLQLPPVHSPSILVTPPFI